MKLWLVRHAATGIAAGTCYGSTNLPADDAATHQAAAALARELPGCIDVVTSPLRRCVQLAQALCQARPDLRYRTDSRLAELDFGTWEGCSWDAIGESAVTAWTDNFWLHAPGGGEPLKSLMSRVEQAWEQALQAQQDCVWITHDGVIRAQELIAKGHRGALQALHWPLQSQAFGSWRVAQIP